MNILDLELSCFFNEQSTLLFGGTVGFGEKVWRRVKTSFWNSHVCLQI